VNRYIQVHEGAETEIEADYAYYLVRNESAALAFLQEIESALHSIASSPLRYPSHIFGSRKMRLARFPHSIIYLIKDGQPFVVAVAHGKRHPGYWRSRL
jgi:plasmid stabilization system protein ParE